MKDVLRVVFLLPGLVFELGRMFVIIAIPVMLTNSAYAEDVKPPVVDAAKVEKAKPETMESLKSDLLFLHAQLAAKDSQLETMGKLQKMLLNERNACYAVVSSSALPDPEPLKKDSKTKPANP